MIDVILVGHGKFASGMYDALKLLNGECKELVYIDFHAGDSFEDLCEKMKKTIENFPDEVLILTDLPGGSPFKAAATQVLTNDKVKAITGTNFPVLLEVILSKNYAENIEELIKNVIHNGKEALMEIAL